MCKYKGKMKFACGHTINDSHILYCDYQYRKHRITWQLQACPNPNTSHPAELAKRSSTRYPCYTCHSVLRGQKTEKGVKDNFLEEFNEVIGWWKDWKLHERRSCLDDCLFCEFGDNIAGSLRSS